MPSLRLGNSSVLATLAVALVLALLWDGCSAQELPSTIEFTLEQTLPPQPSFCLDYLDVSTNTALLEFKAQNADKTYEAEVGIGSNSYPLLISADLTTSGTPIQSQPFQVFFLRTSNSDDNGDQYRLDIFVDLTSNSQYPVDVCTLSYVSPIAKPPSPTRRDAELPRQSDPCPLGTYEGIQQGLICLRSLENDATRQASIMDAVEKTLQFYVYRDVNTADLQPAGVNVDMEAELTRIRTTNYEYEYQLHADLAKLFTSFRDAHANYFGCTSINGPQAFQPFLFSSVMEVDGSQILTVQNIRVGQDPYSSTLSPADYIGYIVRTIDGKDAVDHLAAWADSTESYKDPGTRFNQALSAFSFRTTDLYPTATSVEYVLEHPSTGRQVTLSVPWITRFPASASQLRDSCTTETDGKRHAPISSPKANFPEQIHSRFFTERDVRAPLIYTGISRFDMGLYSLGTDRTVGVLKVGSFLTGDATKTPIVYFMNALHVCHTLAAHRYNFQRLMIDVTGNGGGIGVLQDFAAGYIGNLTSTIFDRLDFQQIHSPAVDDLVPWYAELPEALQLQVPDIWKSPLSSPKPLSPSGAESSPPDAWYSPGVQRSFGGHTSTYSELVEDLNGKVIEDQLVLYRRTPIYHPYTPRDLLAVSDGNCVSACSFFIRQLQEENSMKVIAYGGLVGHQMEPDVSAASVIDSKNIKELTALTADPAFAEHKPPVENLPQYPPGIVLIRVTWSMAFAREDDSTPLEFLFRPADARLDSWSATTSFDDITEALVLASEYFDCCFPWEEATDETCAISCPSRDGAASVHHLGNLWLVLALSTIIGFAV
jgi:hypothetical protein